VVPGLAPETTRKRRHTNAILMLPFCWRLHNPLCLYCCQWTDICLLFCHGFITPFPNDFC